MAVPSSTSYSSRSMLPIFFAWLACHSSQNSHKVTCATSQRPGKTRQEGAPKVSSAIKGHQGRTSDSNPPWHRQRPTTSDNMTAGATCQIKALSSSCHQLHLRRALRRSLSDHCLRPSCFLNPGTFLLFVCPSFSFDVPLKVPISVSLQYTQVSTRWWLVI